MSYFTSFTYIWIALGVCPPSTVLFPSFIDHFSSMTLSIVPLSFCMLGSLLGFEDDASAVALSCGGVGFDTGAAVVVSSVGSFGFEMDSPRSSLSSLDCENKRFG